MIEEYYRLSDKGIPENISFCMQTIKKEIDNCKLYYPISDILLSVFEKENTIELEIELWFKDCGGGIYSIEVTKEEYENELNLICKGFSCTIVNQILNIVQEKLSASIIWFGIEDLEFKEKLKNSFENMKSCDNAFSILDKVHQEHQKVINKTDCDNMNFRTMKWWT